MPEVVALDWRSAEAPEFRLSWDALADLASEPNPFFESWYLLAALRAHDGDGAVKLLTVRIGGDLVAILPVVHMTRYYGRPLPHWSAWMHGNCFLGAPLIARGCEIEAWRAMLAWSDAQGGSGLFLHLPHIPVEGPINAALTVVCTDESRPIGLVHREDRAMLASELGAEAYFEAALTGKKRKELRRQFARLSELGNLRIEHRRDDEHLNRWIDDFLALEHSGWKGTAGSALSSHQATARLFREALSGAQARGRLERLTLWLDDEPVAMLASFVTPPGAFSFKTAFDERYARFSPGVLLQRANLDLLDDPAVAWCDSCAAADHPMIDHIWRERRITGRLSVGIGGPLRRALFRGILSLEGSR